MLYCGKSDVGRKRKENQDHFMIKEFSPELLLAVVCDGMGGQRGGKEASHSAVDAFAASISSFVSTSVDKHGKFDAEDYDIKNALCDAADAANTKVIEMSKDSEELSGMGTTLVSVLVVGSHVYTINIGDSRMYYITRDSAEQISHDHSLVQYLVDIGRLSPEEAENSPNKHIITRAIGSSEGLEADIFVNEIGDKGSPAYLLLCSDGLSNYLSPNEIKSIVTTPCDELLPLFEDLQLRTDALINKANELGGADNITAVIISL